MLLPEYVTACMDRLERSGFAAWVVGGCVRDACLGLVPHDYDMCTSALPEQTEAVFADFPLVLAGKKHGTVGVICGKEVVEITTFRQEGSYGDNRHPDWVRFVGRVEADLARRDFTINAMAWSPTRGYADPFGGREDLRRRILRAVGNPETRFREDSLRILRGLRFAARYALDIEPDTEAAMVALAPSMDNLAAERIFAELCGLLPLLTAANMRRFAPILSEVIPELKPMVGFDQRSPHHAYDLYTHVAHVVENVPAELPLRWAALLHDVGKIPTFTVDETGRGHYYGHAGVSAQMADGILRRLKAPTALREQVVTLVGNHMTRLEPNQKVLRRWLGKLGWETIWQLLDLQKADMGSKGISKPGELEQFAVIQTLLEEIRQEDACLTVKDLAINGHDLLAQGLSGPAIGQTLNRLLELILDEQLENNRETLLRQVAHWQTWE